MCVCVCERERERERESSRVYVCICDYNIICSALNHHMTSHSFPFWGRSLGKCLSAMNETQAFTRTLQLNQRWAFATQTLSAFPSALCPERVLPRNCLCPDNDDLNPEGKQASQSISSCWSRKRRRFHCPLRSVSLSALLGGLSSRASTRRLERS